MCSLLDKFQFAEGIVEPELVKNWHYSDWGEWVASEPVAQRSAYV